MKSIRNTATRLGRAGLAGTLAGLLALALDFVLATLMLDYLVVVDPRLVGAAAVVGLLACGLLEVVLVMAGRGPMRFSRTLAAGIAMVYGGPIYERVEQLVSDRQPPIVAALIGLLFLAGYGIWIWLLGRVLTPGSPTGRRVGWCFLAPILGSLTAAVGLAFNRHILHRPTGPLALLIDTTIVMACLGLAWTLRLAIRGRRGAAAAMGVAVGLTWCALGYVGFSHGSRAEKLTPPVLQATGEDVIGSPHLVLLTIDTLRKDAFDQILRETPEGKAFVDALGPAAWLDNVLATSPWTVPSITSILTGLHPVEHGFGFIPPGREQFVMSRLDDSIETLAESLAGSGYFPAALVTNRLLFPESGIAQGFLDYEWLQKRSDILPLSRFLIRIGWHEPSVYAPAELVTRHFEQLLERVPLNRPLFLWAHWMDPHWPLYPHRDLPLETDFVAREDDGVLDEGLYRQEIRFLFRQLTRVIELLKEHGLWETSLFVLVSDHGEMFVGDEHQGRAHGEIGKTGREGHGHALYGELLRVPVLVRPPGGLPTERHIPILASHVDLYSTIHQLLGLEAKPAPGRRSLARWLAPDPDPEAESGSWPSGLALSGPRMSGPPRFAIRSDGWKLIHSPSGTEADELFDLTTDPGERNNLVEHEPLRRDELKALLGGMLYELGQAPEADKTLELSPEVRRQLKALGYVD